jgi:DNA-binding HxlR family transcriptional regulator
VNEPRPAPQDISLSLTPAQLAALQMDIDWLGFRAAFRSRMVAQGLLTNQWRSPFEADMILSLVAQSWARGRAVTLKELASHLEAFVSDVTVKRHLDDMEAAGIIIRQVDSADRRRVLLIPTERLAEIGRIFLAAKIDIARRHGFVYDPERAAIAAAEIADKM